VGIVINDHWWKQSWTEIRPSTNSSPQPCLTLVSLASCGSSVVSMLMEPTHMFGIAHVPLCSSTVGGVTVLTAGPSSSSPRGTKPLPKKAHFVAFLRVSPLVCVWSHLLLKWPLLLLLPPLTSTIVFCVVGVVARQL
jgi:hypothetical protein